MEMTSMMALMIVVMVVMMMKMMMTVVVMTVVVVTVRLKKKKNEANFVTLRSFLLQLYAVAAAVASVDQQVDCYKTKKRGVFAA